MKRSHQNRWWVIISLVIVALMVLIIAGYWAFKGDGETALEEKKSVQTTLPRMANLPLKKTKPRPPKPSYSPDAPVLEQARKALREGIGPNEAVALAKSLPDRPERADAAFILLEYAAENGNPEAALAVGQFYDPTYGDPSGTIQKNPETAFEWYKEALAGGQEEAKKHLAKLRRWLQEQAEQESRESREILKKWR